MKERPILFSGPMVRAILEGRKTQTRRIAKLPSQIEAHRIDKSSRGAQWFDVIEVAEHFENAEFLKCPYGKCGDRLWVREAFARSKYAADHEGVLWRADSEYSLEERGGARWRPAIHMPRWASRINLEITDIRVERLNDISEVGAIAEGVEAPSTDGPRVDPDYAICPRCGGTGLYTAFGRNGGALPDTDCELCDTHAKRFRFLWESINGAGSWAANPWVWVIEFKRVAP